SYLAILAEVEPARADVEMEAVGSGVLRKILQPAGSTVPVGSLIGVIAEPDEDIAAVASQAGAPAAPAASAAPAAPVAPPPPPRGGPRRARAATGDRPARADANGAGRRGTGDRHTSRRRREPGA